MPRAWPAQLSDYRATLLFDEWSDPVLQEEGKTGFEGKMADLSVEVEFQGMSISSKYA